MPESARGGPRAIPVRKLIGLLGAVVAVVTAVCPPVAYAVSGYWKQHTWMAYRSELTVHARHPVHSRPPCGLAGRYGAPRHGHRHRQPKPPAAQPAPAEPRRLRCRGQGREPSPPDDGPRRSSRHRRLDRRVRADHRHLAAVADRNGAPGPRQPRARHRRLFRLHGPAAARARSLAGQARENQRQVQAAEPDARHGPDQHAPGPGHVRRRRAPGVRQ